MIMHSLMQDVFSMPVIIDGLKNECRKFTPTNYLSKDEII